MDPIRIGFLGFDRLTALDLVGPMDAFASADWVESAGEIKRPYELIVFSLEGKPFTAASGMTIVSQASLRTVPELDTIIIPGGPGAREPDTIEAFRDWLKARAPKTRRVASICTGIHLLASTGLLDGRRATTHWWHVQEVQNCFPSVKIDGDAIYVKSGQFYTSAGVTAGIDLALALIEEDYGSAAAARVARSLVVYLRRAGGQMQYSEPMRLQVAASDEFSGLVPWIIGNLNHDLSVETLAQRCNLSTRQFSRTFKTSFGFTPAELVERLRLDQARTLLLDSHANIQNVATTVGFTNPDSFRRAFSRRFGLSPTAYRTQF